MTTNTHKRIILPTLKFIPTQAQNSLKKANYFVHISPFSKRTSKTNAVVQLHLSSFSIVLLPRLCTWSLNTATQRTTKKQLKVKSHVETYSHVLFPLELTHQATTQWPTKQSVESSLIWRWYLWLYFQRCRWILGHYNYSRQMTLAPNIQIIPKAKQETEGELYIIYLCTTRDLGGFSTSSSCKSIHRKGLRWSMKPTWGFTMRSFVTRCFFQV